MAEAKLRVNDEEYQVIRDRVLERGGRECVDCNYSPDDKLAKELHVHHVLPERLFDEQNPHRVENLVTLCSMCHGAWEKEFRAMMKGRPSWDQQVRNRIRKHLGDDTDFLREHFPEAYELVVDEVCPDQEDGGDNE